MNLPFVLDVAIGLLLIFLIFSLLVSEIQELITALLQWRAQHLKESIEMLLAGGIETKKEAEVKGLVNKLYDDPLIKNITYEAKGIPGQARKFVQWLLPFDFRTIFGGNRTTGPSYMDAETFTASFLEQTGLAVLARKLAEVRLENFAERIVGIYDVKEILEPDGSYKRVVTPRPDGDVELERLWNQGRVRLIAKNSGFDLKIPKNLDSNPANWDSNLTNFINLVNEFADVVLDFKNQENNLETSISRMEESLNTYIEQYPNDTKFANGLKSLKRSIFGDKTERALASNTLRPSLLEFAELLDKSSQTYQEVQKSFKGLIQKGSWLDRLILSIALKKLLGESDKLSSESDYFLSKIGNLFNEDGNSLSNLSEDDNPLTHFNENEPLDNQHKTNYEILIKQILYDCPKEMMVAIKTLQDKHEIRNLDTKKLDLLCKKIRLLEESLCKEKESNRTFLLGEYIPKQARLKKEIGLWSQRQRALRRRRQMLGSIIYKFREDEQIKLTRSTIDLVQDRLYSNLENDNFGLIDHALDHLPNEERHKLIYDSITAIKIQYEATLNEPWSKEFEVKVRSLYSDYDTYKRLQMVLSQLPGSIKESFATLARRAQTRLNKTESNIEQFRKEVAVWFDQSMERASGVYKRNAKGVSILLGILVAFLMNVDSLYVMSRLSNDEKLRRVVTEGAIELSTSSNDGADELADLDRLRDETDKLLKQMILPIGWHPQNLDAQLRCSPNPTASQGLVKIGRFWESLQNPNSRQSITQSGRGYTDNSDQIPTSWQDFYDQCLGNAAPSIKQGQEDMPKVLRHIEDNSLNGVALLRSYWLDVIRMVVGWVISGIAISMGAPFWFDLLNRIINVRQAGSKPEATTKPEPTSTGAKSSN